MRAYFFTCFISGFHSVSIANKSSSNSGDGSGTSNKNPQKSAEGLHINGHTFEIWSECIYRLLLRTILVMSKARTHARMKTYRNIRTHLDRWWEKKKRNETTHKHIKLWEWTVHACAEVIPMNDGTKKSPKLLPNDQQTPTDRMVLRCIVQSAAHKTVQIN